jgi:cyclopropane fatty-acyl-phospholipid synthase-like methyltransferase
MKKNNFTTQDYWENYYSKSSADRDTIVKICGKFDSLWDELVDHCHIAPKTIIEIGAYPGRFLAYLAAKYKLEATALDYNSDTVKLEDSFKTMGVTNYHIIQSDFLKYEPTEKYDLVISNGFIEHFDNYEEVLNLHANYLAPGGTILLFIPNKRYLRKWYGQLLDNANLKVHNLSCMHLGTFEKFATVNKLETIRLTYLGGFAYKVHQSLNLFQKIIYKLIRFLSMKLEKKLAANPSKYWSGTIVFIGKK